jgi:MoxR-like ATPase
MTMTGKIPYYSGIPEDVPKLKRLEDLPTPDPARKLDPAKYYAPTALRDAVNVALELGLPLLLTGEPGVGKSSLARSVNRWLGFKEEDLLHLTVKSDIQSSDLFYRFDTLSRFHATHDPSKTAEEASGKHFIRYHALGRAILLAKGRNGIPGNLMPDKSLNSEDYPKERRRSVVLIDEIDKAPRDIPNDILNEIERMEFTVPELFIDTPIKLEGEDHKHRPIVIITSNSERELPEAFLRRCLYYHLEMPPFREDLDQSADPNEPTVESIVAARFGDLFEPGDHVLQDALSLFRHLRGPQGPQRKPSLAELLDWLHYLGKRRLNGQPLLDRADFEISLKTTLLKYQDDQNAALTHVQAWQQTLTQ